MKTSSSLLFLVGALCAAGSASATCNDLGQDKCLAAETLVYRKDDRCGINKACHPISMPVSATIYCNSYDGYSFSCEAWEQGDELGFDWSLQSNSGSLDGAWGPYASFTCDSRDPRPMVVSVTITTPGGAQSSADAELSCGSSSQGPMW